MVNFGPVVAVYLCLQSHVHSFMVIHTVLAPRDIMASIATTLYELLEKEKWLAKDDNILVFNVADYEVEPVQMHHEQMGRVNFGQDQIANFFKRAMSASSNADLTLVIEIDPAHENLLMQKFAFQRSGCNELREIMATKTSATMGRLTQLSYIGPAIDVEALPATGTVPDGWVDSFSQ